MCRKALVPFQFRWIIPHIVMLPLGGRVCGFSHCSISLFSRRMF
nr:MAG TPA: hypothetical protein [Caudoviricetes sp.]